MLAANSSEGSSKRSCMIWKSQNTKTWNSGFRFMAVHLLNGINWQNGLSITTYTLTMSDGSFKSPGSMIFTNATSSQRTFLKLMTTFFGLCLRLPRILAPIQHFIDSCSKLENNFVQVLKKHKICLAEANTASHFFFHLKDPISNCFIDSYSQFGQYPGQLKDIAF